MCPAWVFAIIGENSSSDRRFFQIVLDGEGIDPAETLFLDDGQRNVESAAALGIKTYLVENGSDWTKAIYDFLK